MGQGSEVKTRPDPKVEIQEKGEVFFFYRPKVDKEEAHSPDDVQRMYVVLRPESVPERGVEEKQAPDSGKEGKKRKTRHGGGDDDKGGSGGGEEGGHGKEEVNVEERPLLRLIVMGKKSLPDPAKHGRPFWGYVDLVTTDVEDIKDALKGEEYETQDARQAAQAGGEGAGRGRVPHRQARGPRRRTRAHPPRVQARAALAVRGRRRRRAAGGHERGAGGVVPGADQEPGAGRRVRRAAGEAQGRVPGAPAGAIREQPVRAGRPAGPAQLRGVRAAAHLGVRRRGGGAGPGAADRDGEGNRARGPCRRGVLGPGEDVRRGGRREAAAERELGLGTPHTLTTFPRQVALD